MPHLIGQLSAEEACAVVAKAVQSQQQELAGYDYICIVRSKNDGQASCLSSIGEDETIRTTLRRLLEHMAVGGRNVLRGH